jgi:hypothetical protein
MSLENANPARSARLTEIASRMRGSLDSAYKRSQRFLKNVEYCEIPWRLSPDNVPFAIADITEIPCPQACKTSYMGMPKDGRTGGFWLMTLAVPYKGCAIPCAL